MKAPVVIDPFSRLGDHVAGETAEEVALNLGRSLAYNKPGAPLLHSAPNLQRLFADRELSPAAQEAIRRAAAVFRSSRKAPTHQ